MRPSHSSANSKLHRIVIVGGGAGGIELATKLGNTLGKKKLAHITLVDTTLSHVWKPLLHEIACGTKDSHLDDIEYLAQSSRNYFDFRLGRMDRLDRENRNLSLAPTLGDDGQEYVSRRNLKYNTLIIAVGSVFDDFGIVGVAEHTYSLDTRQQAERFHSHLLKQFYLRQTQEGSCNEVPLHVAIVGGGATGVELAAELRDSTRELASYGLDNFDPNRDLQITLIEAASHILPTVPLRVSDAAVRALVELNVDTKTGDRVVKATEGGFQLASGEYVASGMKVWAAGIKAPDFLRNIDGLETNSINQLVVKPTLQTTFDDNIFAFGDCAACAMKGNENVPPRAQAAHQQAMLLANSMKKRLRGESLRAYRYVDFGSLVNLGSYTTVGNLMGNLLGRFNSNFMIEGLIARFIYKSLYKMHLVACYGFLGTLLQSIGTRLIRKGRRRLKFH